MENNHLDSRDRTAIRAIETLIQESIVLCRQNNLTDSLDQELVTMLTFDRLVRESRHDSIFTHASETGIAVDVINHHFHPKARGSLERSNV